MQGPQIRALILTAIFAAGAVLNWAGSGSARAEARWPADNSFYSIPGWSASEPAVTQANGVDFVTRTYLRPGDSSASAAVLTVATSPSSKAIYRAGADVRFLGSGYAVEDPPLNSIPSAEGRSALIVRRGSQAGAVLYAYGEQRGLLGNGPLAWAWVGVDAVLGRSNDYYLATLVVPYDPITMKVDPEFIALADAVLPALAAWYRTA